MLALRRGGRAARPARARVLAGIGLLDLGANALYNYSSTIGELSTVAVASSLYPVVTVLLAAALLGERVRGIQRVGVVVRCAGVRDDRGRGVGGRGDLSAWRRCSRSPPACRSPRCRSRPRSRSGVMYFVRARTLAARWAARAEGWRQWCWYGGLAIIVVALCSPLGTLSEELFLAHMSEHLLIADLGALVLVLGLTGPLLAPLLRAPGLGWMRGLSHPVPAFGLWAVDLLFWHLVGPHEAAVRNDTVHALQHMLFVGFGINMWLALLGPLPKPAWFGNAAKMRLHHRRAADRRRSWRTSSCGPITPTSASTRPASARTGSRRSPIRSSRARS